MHLYNTHLLIAFYIFISIHLPPALIFSSLIYSFTHLFTLSSCVNLLNTLVYSFLLPLNYTFIHSFLPCLFIKLRPSLNQCFLHPLTLSFISSFILSFMSMHFHSSLHSLIQWVVPLVHSFIHHSTRNDLFINNVFGVSIWCDCSHATPLAFSSISVKGTLGLVFFQSKIFIVG